MKLRYRITSNNYVPQILNKDNIWRDIKQTEIKGLLRDVANKLANLSNPRRYSTGLWYVENNSSEVYDVVFFTKEIFVMAFLGAYKSYFNQEMKEFEL